MRLPQMIITCALLLLFTNLALPISTAAKPPQCKAWLVQSIPTDMPHLRRVSGVLSTADVLRWLAGNSTANLDVIAQYWQLIAHPDDPQSGDFGYTKDDMKKFDAEQGFSVYKALEDAADRDVNIRIIQHSGVYPDYANESADLASGRPNVKNVTLLLGNWWGSGIVHTKVWISDCRDVYIGSANNDWKSLTQVKEVGVYLAGCPEIARKVEVYFNNLWKLAYLNSSENTKVVSDQQWQLNRTVPCWSHFLAPEARCRSPLPHFINVPQVVGYPPLSNPRMLKVQLETPGCSYKAKHAEPNYLSFAPPELSFDRHQTDEQGWVDTIKSVGSGGTVRMNTMDWLGQSQYLEQTVYWSSISSAISEVVFSKQAKVKILVAYWAHFISNTDEYLKSLLYSNVLCSSSKYNNCSGKVEIKYYVVPGYNLTGPGKVSGNVYPSYSRVNHGKYAVSDVRAHIGTSNLVWDYFYTTAGVSFGTYNLGIVSQLQEIFEADWNSPYVVPVKGLGTYSSGVGSTDQEK